MKHFHLPEKDYGYPTAFPFLDFRAQVYPDRGRGGGAGLQTVRWGFRLTVNPTRRVTINGVAKILAHVSVEHQTRWLLSRASAIGVSFGHEEEPHCRLVRRNVRKFRRGGETVTLGVASFDGMLTVTDAGLLRSALVSGIGRAKAYGCGLMTLARL